MNRIGLLLVRNLKVAVRDRTTILLTILPPLALVVLGLLTLRWPLAEALVGAAPARAAAADAWVFGSAAVLAGFAAGAAVLWRFVDDRRNERVELFRAGGASGWQILGAYGLTLVIVCTAMSLGVIILSQLWALLLGQPVLSAGRWLEILLGLLLGALFYAALTGLVATWITSPGTFGAYCLIGNVTFAFLSLSYGLLGLLPFAQVAALVRGPLLAPSVSVLQTGDILGTTMPWAGWITAMMLVLWSAVLVVLAWVRMDRAFEPIPATA